MAVATEPNETRSLEPLRGLIVLELPNGMAGAVAGLMLSEHGARVLKFEHPSLDGGRGAVGREVWDRGKESIELTGERLGVTDLADFLHAADVVLQQHHSVSPDWSIDEGELLAINPRLVVCSISLFGVSGPLQHRPGSDALVAARLGHVVRQLGWEPGPTYIADPLPSMAAALLSVQGICGGLLERETIGHGQRVDVSLLSAAAALDAVVEGGPWRYSESFREAPSLPPRKGGPIGPLPFAALYQCADGRWLALASLHEGFIDKTLVTLGIAEAAHEIVRGASLDQEFLLDSAEPRNALFDLVAAAIRRRPLAEWTAILDAADVPYAPLSTREEAVQLLEAHGRLQKVTDPRVGTGRQLASPLRFDERPSRFATAPTLGADTARLSREFSGSSRVQRVEASGPAEARATSPGPLAGVRVLELANVIAGPMSCRYLADLGADIVKLESHEGDIARRGRSPEFQSMNAGKRSIIVDLKNPAGREIGLRLAGRADVIVNNMRPGAAERLGLGWEQLRHENPDLIYVQITGYGSEGPLASKPGFDMLARAIVGLMTPRNDREQGPLRIELAMVDHMAALLGATGAVMALVGARGRRRSTRVQTSLLDAAMLIGSEDLVRDPSAEPSTLASQYGPDALNSLYPTHEGWVQLAASGASFEALCEVLGFQGLTTDPRFRTDGARHRHDAELYEALRIALSRDTAVAWSDRLESIGIGCAPVGKPAEVGYFSDPQVIAEGLIASLATPAGGVMKVAHRYVTLSRSVVGCRGAPPAHGEHTIDVLHELGYDEGRIAELTASGAVASGPSASGWLDPVRRQE
jgi:crotonobetainyl-CoA:carnitine CoA-transferase CaiB-like acyl-CoA transferase